jgi:hypothetical protein
MCSHFGQEISPVSTVRYVFLGGLMLELHDYLSNAGILVKISSIGCSVLSEKVYVLCGSLCFQEAATDEQIYP